MTRAIPESHPLHRLFRGLTEHTFMTELGIGDPGLVGYVANLLAWFVPSHDDLAAPRRPGAPAHARSPRWSPRPRPPPTPTAAASATATSATSPCSGPASIPRPWPSSRRADSPDHLIDFQPQGKRSYYLASTLDGRRGPGPPPPQRRVRALRLRPLAGPPRVGDGTRPRPPRGPIAPGRRLDGLTRSVGIAADRARPSDRTVCREAGLQSGLVRVTVTASMPSVGSRSRAGPDPRRASEARRERDATATRVSARRPAAVRRGAGGRGRAWPPPRASALASHLLWFDAAGASSHGIATLPGLARPDRSARKSTRSPRAGRGSSMPGRRSSTARTGCPRWSWRGPRGSPSEKARDAGVGLVRVREPRPDRARRPPVAAELAIGPFVGADRRARARRWPLALPMPEGLPAVFDSGPGGDRRRRPSAPRPRLARALVALDLGARRPDGRLARSWPSRSRRWSRCRRFHERVAAVVRRRGRRPGPAPARPLGGPPPRGPRARGRRSTTAASAGAPAAGPSGSASPGPPARWRLDRDRRGGPHGPAARRPGKDPDRPGRDLRPDRAERRDVPRPARPGRDVHRSPTRRRPTRSPTTSTSTGPFRRSTSSRTRSTGSGRVRRRAG